MNFRKMLNAIEEIVSHYYYPAEVRETKLKPERLELETTDGVIE